jgi:flagellar biosynthesis/type III secretory pathway chaperone
MDAGVCRAQLATLLDEELALLAQLEQLLQAERELIGSRDLAGLQGSIRARQERLTALAAVEEQRRLLCSRHGRAVDRAGLEQLIKWCDPTAALVPRLRERAARALRCRDLNDRNGLTVSARLKRVGELLQALTGGNPRADTYGRRGYLSRGQSGRVLGAV